MAMVDNETYGGAIRAGEDRVKDVLLDADTTATTLMAAVVRVLGDDAFEGENGVPPDPLDLWAGIHDRLGIWIPEANENKINAMLTLLSGDGFYEDPVVFSAVANSLSTGDLGEAVNGVFEPPTAAEAVWAIYEAGLLEEEDRDFDEPVIRFLDGIFSEEVDETGNAHMEAAAKARMKLRDEMAYLGAPPEVLEALEND